MGLQKIVVLPEMTIEELVKQIIHSAANQIILEVPAETGLLTNEINLRLLKFYAEEETKEILLNAADPVLIMLARKIGLATISDNLTDVSTKEEASYLPAIETPDATQGPLPVLQPGFSLKQGGLFIAIPVALFTLAIAVWWFFQPKATILVYSKEESLDFTTVAQISSLESETVPETGKVPAKWIEKNSRLEVRTVTTGSKFVGVTAATGRLSLINPTNQPIVVPKQSTVIAKTGMRFFTDQDVMVPKKSTNYRRGVPIGENYGQAEVAITAAQKGSAGNLPAKAINRIDGKMLRFLQVTNLVPTSNGTDKQIAVVTLEDVKKGEAEAKRQLELVGPGELSSLITKDFLFLPELVQCETVRLEDTPEIGAEGDELRTVLEYRVTTLAPPVAELSKLLSYHFEKGIPSNFQSSRRKLELVSTKVITTGRQSASIQLIGRGYIKGILNADRIRQWIKGKTILEAKEELTRRNEISDFKIDVAGGGTQLPVFAFQIKVLLPAGPK